MKQAHESLNQLNLICLLALKAPDSQLYMYTCINLNNKPPMDNVNEYDLNYAIPVSYQVLKS